MVKLREPNTTFKQPHAHCTGYAWKWGMMLLKFNYSERDVIILLENTPNKIGQEHPLVPDKPRNRDRVYNLEMPEGTYPITGVERVPQTVLHGVGRLPEQASDAIVKSLRNLKLTRRVALGLSVHYEYPDQNHRHGAHCFGLFMDETKSLREGHYFRFFDPNVGSWWHGSKNDLLTWLENEFLIAFQEGSVRGDPGHATNKLRIVNNFRVTEIVG
jgi:hypothetical protein